MFALFPQCGDTSGASLGVRSVALLHLRKVLFWRQGFLFILCIALNPHSGDFSGAILEVPFKALLHGVLSVEIGKV